MKALLVGDEELTGPHAQELRSRGWHVLAAADAAGALMTAGREQPDIVVVSARVATSPGHEVVANLRRVSATATTPVVGLVNLPSHVEAFRDAGAQRCLAAAIEPGALAAVVTTELASVIADDLAPDDDATGTTDAADPLGDAAWPAPLEAGVTSSDEPLTGAPIHGRVVLVEDDPSVLSMLRQALELEGHEVAAFDTAPPALAACLTAPPDLLLLDVMLPGMSGLELLAELKRHTATRELPVVLVSGLHDATVVEGLRRGARDYIRKPFDIDEVLARIATALDAKQERDALKTYASHLERVTLVERRPGMDNRVAGQRQVEELAARAARTGQVLSLLLVDIDGFEQVVAGHGHEAGDQLISTAVRRLSTGTRSSDVVARWRDGQILVLLPDTDVEGASTAAERLRTAVAELEVAAPGADGPARSLTLSMGVAALQDGPHQLLFDADAALRQAQATGRSSIATVAARSSARASAGLMAAATTEDADRGVVAS